MVFVTRITLSLLAAIPVSVAVAACGSSVDDRADQLGYEVVRASTVDVGDGIPRPTGEVILTVSGAVTAAGDDGVVELDMATLEAMGTVAYEVFDHQAEGRTVRFEGVLLQRLLAVVGASGEATTLVTVALNDYAVDIPVSDAHASPVMIATSADGERMPVERYGPIRIVYPYDTHDLDHVVHDPRWIWQLASIEVR